MGISIYSIVWKQFKERKLRSFLTITGVVIGITAVVGLIILSNGLKYGITKELDVFGADEILLTAKASITRGNPVGYGFLTMDDIRVVKSIPQIEYVDVLLQASFDVSYGKERKKVLVSGVGADEKSERTAESFFNMDLLEGRYIENNDYKTANIGYKTAFELFEKDVQVGSTIRINGDKYKVVGIFEEQGELIKDNVIYVPIKGLRDTIGDPKALTSASAKVSSGSDVDFVLERVKEKLKRYRGKDDINIITPRDLKETINELLGVINLVVVSIAFISLFVGALGIMNSMFTSVIQRTREIGVMKAIGATRRQILSIFVLESAIFGFFGGVIGLILGITFSFGGIWVVNSLGFIKIVLIPDYLLFAGSVIFSTLLGVASGTIPALKAARLDPVEALRYE